MQKYLILNTSDGLLSSVRIFELEIEGGIDQAVFDFFRSQVFGEDDHSDDELIEFIESISEECDDNDQRLFMWCDDEYHFSRVDDIELLSK